MVLAAYDAYLVDGDILEFKDTLVRIVRLSKAGKNAIKVFSNLFPSLFSSTFPSPNHACTVTPQLKFSSFQEIISYMLSKCLVSSTGADILGHLMHKDNEFILAALHVYTEDQDAEELLDTLLRILKVCVESIEKEQAGDQARTLALNDAGDTEFADFEELAHGFIQEWASKELLLEEFPLEAILEQLDSQDARDLDHFDIVTLEALCYKEHPLVQVVFEAFLGSLNAEILSQDFQLLAHYFGLQTVLEELLMDESILTLEEAQLLMEMFEAQDPMVLGGMGLLFGWLEPNGLF